MDSWAIVHERASMKENFQAKSEKQAVVSHDGEMLRAGKAGLTLCPFSLNHYTVPVLRDDDHISGTGANLDLSCHVPLPSGTHHSPHPDDVAVV